MCRECSASFRPSVLYRRDKVGISSCVFSEPEREREREREKGGAERRLRHKKRDGGDEANEGDTEAGMGHATTGRLVARGGDKRANTILPRLLRT